MHIKPYLICFLLVLAGAGAGFAQQAKVKKATKYTADGRYKEAVEIFLEVLDKNDISEAKRGIAECYHKLGNFNEQVYWYGLVVQLPDATPTDYLRYAQALQATNDCKKAKLWAEKTLKIDPSNVTAQLLLKACTDGAIQNLRASGALYKVSHVKEINTDKDDFSPAVYQEDKLVFVSNREDKKAAVVRTDAWDGKPFTALYYSGRKLTDPKEFKFSYSKPEKFSKTLQSKYHDGPITFSKDGTEAYLSRNNMEGRSDDGVVRLKIYKVTGKELNWADAQGVPFNSDEYSCMHPSLAEDGQTLFFSSNMPGGFGGLDLYASYMEEGRWSPPVNLGPTVNTESDEAFPFIHPDGTLYFASNGLTGLGGYDIYFSKESFGAWTDPTNLGFPINTAADDISIVLNKQKTHGYFASNRAGSEAKGGDDIYTFTKLSAEVEVLVINEKTKMPIEGAEVFTPCSAVKSFTTNADGKVFMEIALDKSCDFAAEKNPYKPNSVRQNTKELRAGDKLLIQIPLSIEKVYDLSGTVIDGYTKDSLSGVLVKLVYDCGGESDSMMTSTNSNGGYDFKSIREDCDFMLKLSKIGYNEHVTTFTTGGLTDSVLFLNQPLFCDGDSCKEKKDSIQKDPTKVFKDPVKKTYDPDSCKTVKDKKGNRYLICKTEDSPRDTIYKISPKGDTTWYYKKFNPKDPGTNPDPGAKQIVNIYYDFDDASIRSDAQPDLENLVRFLNAFPDAEILITSHTDARGTKFYNRRLSNRRAESVVKYLLAAGISKKRLKADGMGEEVMINDCYDGYDCTEVQHQENRRTEFQITKNGVKEKSKKPEKIKTRPCKNCETKPAVE